MASTCRVGLARLKTERCSNWHRSWKVATSDWLYQKSSRRRSPTWEKHCASTEIRWLITSVKECRTLTWTYRSIELNVPYIFFSFIPVQSDEGLQLASTRAHSTLINRSPKPLD
jgi:hypothetical protein